jgi:hypothetical protein
MPSGGIESYRFSTPFVSCSPTAVGSARYTQGFQFLPNSFAIQYVYHREELVTGLRLLTKPATPTRAVALRLSIPPAPQRQKT